MDETTRCKRCILPSSLPTVRLDDQGVCSLCQDYIKRREDYRDSGPRKKQEFEAVVERVRSLRHPYDCLVPLSGGKDSTYALYICDRIYKLKCLCVTFDNGFLSRHAITNIQNAVRSSRADHIMVTMNRPSMLKLYKLFLEKTGTFCPACLRGIGLALNVAQKYRVPLTVSGTGWQVTYLAGIPEVYQGGDIDFFRNVVRGEPIEREVLPLLENVSKWNFARIMKIASRLLKIPRLTETHYVRLYDHFDPDYEKIYDIITREMGWSAGEETSAEHLDCELHAVAGHLQHLKFPDLTGHTIHRAGLVRMGKIERDTALAQDLEESSRLGPPEKLTSFLKELNMTADEYYSYTQDWKTLTRFRTGKKSRLRSLYHKLTKQ